VPPIITGMIDTEDILTDERVIDMDEEIKFLDPDTTQFTTMLMKLGSDDAIREKVNWMEDDLFPRMVTLGATAATGDSALQVAAGDSAVLRIHDLLRNMVSGEMVRVTAVNADSNIVVTRGIGGVAAASSITAAKLLIVGNAAAQGATLGDIKATKRVLQYNFTQIFRHPFSFTETQTKIELYGGREPAKEAAKKAIEHKRAIEYSLFWGARGQDTSAAQPRGYSGGLVEYISTNVNNQLQTPLTSPELDQALLTFLQHGSKNKVLFVSPVVSYNLSQMAMSNYRFLDSAKSSDGTLEFGVRVDAYIAGGYGTGIPVIVKRDWNDFPTTNAQYGGWAFLVDMDYVKLRPLRERSTKILNNRQAPDADAQTSEYLTELSLEVAQEKTHGILKGITTT
jgi:Family of unknown function (DUF5309)